MGLIGSIVFFSIVIYFYIRHNKKLLSEGIITIGNIKNMVISYIIIAVVIVGTLFIAHMNITSNSQHLADKELIEKEDADDGYEDIGEAVVYNTLIGDQNELNSEPTSYFHLFMKSHGGDKYYYLGENYKGSKKHLLEKGSWTKRGMHFNARFYMSSVYWYTNVSAWSSSGSNSGGSTRVIHDDSPRAVQEWVPCPVCGNTVSVGLCQNCNGTGQDLYYTRDYRDCPRCGGLKKCTVCGGNGGDGRWRHRHRGAAQGGVFNPALRVYDH